MSLILPLKRQRQVDVSEFYARLGYKVRCCLNKIKEMFEDRESVLNPPSSQGERYQRHLGQSVTLYLVLSPTW